MISPCRIVNARTGGPCRVRGMNKHRLAWSVVAVASGPVLLLSVLVPVLLYSARGGPVKEESPAVRAAAIRGTPRDGNEHRPIEGLKAENPAVGLTPAGRL